MSQSEHAATGKVLIVEDNDFVRMQIATFLKGEGYDVVEASDGVEGLDVIDKKVNLAVVDVRMEPMGGFEFIQVLESEGYKIPVVLVTGDQNSDLLEKAGQHSVSSVLLKPVQKDKLLNMVKRLIARGR
jgi:CheY-like chemotaxis protein